MFLDCTTKDLERLTPRINALSLEIQQAQNRAAEDLEPREKIILIIASLAQLKLASERAAKKTSTPRFIRTILTAYSIARNFGTGELGGGKS
jgi:hypothetical protein